MTIAVVAGFLILRAPRALPRRRSGSGPLDEADCFDAVAAELRRGASLRQGIAWALPGSRAARLAIGGQPIALVAAEVAQQLDSADRLATAGIALAGHSGAPSAVLFSRLAERARQRAQLARDIRTLTAQARMSAAVVGLIPVGIGFVLLAARGTEALGSQGAARSAVIGGVVMQLAGLLVITLILRAAR